MTPEEIVKRCEHQEADRKGTVEDTWDNIERFVAPYRGEFYKIVDSEAEVDWRKRQIYDSTAVHSAKRLASAIHVGITTPDGQWFELMYRDDDLNADDEAKEWLEDTGKRVWRSLMESNFNLAINEHYLDLTSFGNGALVEEIEDEKTGKLLFKSVPIKEFQFEEDSKGQAYNMYRTLKWTALQILDKFGDEVPESIRKEADSAAGGTTRHDVIFCVYRRKDVPDDTGAKMLAPKARPYGYKYVLKQAKTQLGEEGGYYEMPVFLTRWGTVSGSKWGHSPAHEILADIMTLNELTESKLEAIAKAVDPPYETTQRNIIGDLDLSRAGLTVTRKAGELRPLPIDARVDWATIEADRLQEGIRNAFYIDQLQLKESPAMTATEVNERRRRLQQQMSAVVGRLESDLLSPMIKLTMNALFRAGQLKSLPETLSKTELDIEYTGPLPLAMKVDEAGSIRSWLGLTAELAQVYPEMRDVPDPHKAIRYLGELQGVPAIAMRGEDEIRKIEAGRQQEANAAKAAEAGQALGDTVKNVGSGVKSLNDAGVSPAQLMEVTGG